MSGWVCPECGLDYDTISPHDTVGAVRSYPRRYRAALAAFGPGEEGDQLIRRRPTPSTWSALEYTAHAADVLDLTVPSLRRIMVEDKPTLFFFDSDTQAAEQDYNSQERSEVLANLETACADLAGVMEGIGADDWGRTGIFAWGERDA